MVSLRLATLGGRKPLRSADLISLPLGPANLALAIFHLANAHTLWDETDNLVSEGINWHLGIGSWSDSVTLVLWNLSNTSTNCV